MIGGEKRDMWWLLTAYNIVNRSYMHLGHGAIRVTIQNVLRMGIVQPSGIYTVTVLSAKRSIPMANALFKSVKQLIAH